MYTQGYRQLILLLVVIAISLWPSQSAGERNVTDGLLAMPEKRPNQGLLVETQPPMFFNPGNIEIGQGYAGETGGTYADRFAIFDSPQMGIRAIAKDITTKIKRHDGDLSKIINQYAPPSENDTNRYLDFVQTSVGKKKVTKEDLPKVVEAIIKMENGPDSDLTKIYLDKKIFSEAMELSDLDLPSNTGLEEARKKK